MTPLDKIHLAVEDLRARGVRHATAAPLVYRLLWRLGIAIPPPLYQSVLGTLVLHGFLFGVLLGTVLACADRRLAPYGAILFGTLGGVVYGTVMAANYRLRARRLGLSTWNEYLPGAGTDEDEGWWSRWCCTPSRSALASTGQG
jgi:hypothetical protein